MVWGADPMDTPRASIGYAQDHIIVQFKSNLLSSPTEGALITPFDLTTLDLPPGCTLKEPAFSRWLKRHQPPQNGIHAHHQLDQLDFKRPLYLELPEALSAPECVERLNQHPLIEYAELDVVGTGGTTIPNDPNFPLQWYHRNLGSSGGSVPADIRSTEAWDLTQGSSNITVAILDTGLNTNLTEFIGRTVPGYDFVNDDNDPDDDHGHGTSVAGTLGANASNATLVAGMNWQCKIMPIKVLDASNTGFYSWWSDGIDYAVSNGCNVINLSAGGFPSSTTLSNSIMNAIAQGVIFVTISHNDGMESIRFPGRMEACITVGATSDDDHRWASSNYGPELDLVAPGQSIFTVSNTGTLQFWNGTSFAAPLVSGVAAMLVGLQPNLNQYQVERLLTLGADDEVGDALEDMQGYDPFHGWGRLNAYNSLILLQTEIDTIEKDQAENVMVTWTKAPNAETKKPYQISYTDNLTNNWITIASPSNLTYQTSTVQWMDDGTDTGIHPSNLTGRCYRVQITSPE